MLLLWEINSSVYIERTAAVVARRHMKCCGPEYSAVHLLLPLCHVTQTLKCTTY